MVPSYLSNWVFIGLCFPVVTAYFRFPDLVHFFLEIFFFLPGRENMDLETGSHTNWVLSANM